MPPTADPSVPATPLRPQQPDSPFDAIAFQLDYIAAKLNSIHDEYGEALDEDLAHDLHSTWDAVQQARAALRGPAVTGPTVPEAGCIVDFDDYAARWDRANEPISRSFPDRPARRVAEWASARTRYELAFIETVRPAPVDAEYRLARLRKAEVELDRTCAALTVSQPDTVAVPECL
jgi:hypothetical protein